MYLQPSLADAVTERKARFERELSVFHCQSHNRPYEKKIRSPRCQKRPPGITADPARAQCLAVVPPNELLECRSSTSPPFRPHQHLRYRAPRHTERGAPPVRGDCRRVRLENRNIVQRLVRNGQRGAAPVESDTQWHDCNVPAPLRTGFTRIWGATSPAFFLSDLATTQNT